MKVGRKKFNCRRWVLAMCMLCSSAVGLAQSDLKAVLLEGLNKEPQLMEANANLYVARMQVEQAKSGHYPVVRVYGQQPVQRSNSLDDNDKRFEPGAGVTLNLFAFGAINKKINYAKANADALAYKYEETKENVAYRIVELYLMAIRSQENVNTLNASLDRLNRILSMMESVAHIDRGRRSEYVQAQSRVFAVEQQLAAAERELGDNLSQLQRYTRRSVSEIRLINPFTQDNAAFKQQFAGSMEKHPSYQTAQASIDSAQAAISAEKTSRLPRVDLVGKATRSDKEVYLNVSWDLFNRESAYGVREKAGVLEAQTSRLDQTVLDLEQRNRVALINMDLYARQTATLGQQIQSQEQVVEFYKMQFSIARRSLLDVLNAENDLLNAEMGRVNAEYQYRHSALDYLYAQGTTVKWATELE